MKYKAPKAAPLSMALMMLAACTFFSKPFDRSPSWETKLESLEKSSGGRIGISAFDTTTNKHFNFRSEERFPFSSTFKAVLAAAILKEASANDHLLSKRIPIDKETVQSAGYSPITSKHVDTGMTVSELCAATLQYSDNLAANLLIKELGGLGAVNKFTKFIGDDSFRLDRWEPNLNTAIPEDVRDTTTPAAMERTLRSVVLGDILNPKQREQIQDWLKGNTTGASRIKAGVPSNDWIVGDKTGTGDYGTTNDIAVLWPPNRAPIVIVVYFTQKEKDAKPREAIVAEATKIVISAITEN
jgi:beta-lactamase class A